MFFDWKTLLWQLARAVVRTRRTPRRLTPRRLRFLTIFSVLFLVGQVTTWIALALDHLFYPGFRRIDTDSRTLFIVGNFRSGSTFLHRLLSDDRDRFTTLSSWEIYAAPSIIQRKFYRGLKLVDSMFGSPLYRGLRAWDRRVLQPVPFHSVSIWNPEEDVGLLSYCWYSLLSWFFFPDWEPIKHLISPGSVSGPRRRRIGRFYEACVKRHLYGKTSEVMFVSKNPSFTPLVEELSIRIPGARFIALVRHPIDTFVSTLIWFNLAWHAFADPPGRFIFQDEVAEMVSVWFNALLRYESSTNAMQVVRFASLIEDPLATVKSIYRNLGLPIGPERARVLGDLARTEPSDAMETGARALSVGLDPLWLTDRFRDTVAAHGFAVDERDEGPRSKTDVGISTLRTMDQA